MKKFPNMDNAHLVVKNNSDKDLEIARAFFAFRLASKRALGKFEGYFTKFNMRHSQVAILLALHVNEDKTETSINISHKLGLSTATISNVLQTKWKKDFIKKEKQDNDKRFYNITLKEAGRNFLKDFIPDYQSYYERLFSDFTEEEIKALEKLSLKLYVNLENL